MRTLVHICCGPCGITVLQRLRTAGHDPSALFFNPNIHPLAEYLRRREGAQAVCKRLNIAFIAADARPEDEQIWAAPVAQATPAPQIEPAASATPAAFPLPAAPATPSAPARLSATVLLPSHNYTPGHGAFRVSPAANPAPWLAVVAGDPKNRCPFCWQSRLDFCASYAARHGFEAFTTSLLYSRYQNHEVIRRMGEESAARNGVGFVYEDFRTSWQEGVTLSKEWGIYRQQYCGCVYSEYERYAKEFTRTVSAVE